MPAERNTTRAALLLIALLATGCEDPKARQAREARAFADESARKCAENEQMLSLARALDNRRHRTGDDKKLDETIQQCRDLMTEAEKLANEAAALANQH